jgi:HK97 family phage prohead protease/HK97 family phage major capsid protein
MPKPRTLAVGKIETRSVEGEPSRFTGLAVPWDQTIDVSYGREKFVRGAFSEQISSGERLAYLNKHGTDGGIPVGVIDTLQERSDGLYFSGVWMSKPEAEHSQTEIASGLNGVSVEFVPGKYRRKGDTVEHYSGVRLAAVAGSYAPAYRSARVALRNVERVRNMPGMSATALTERRDSQISIIRQMAESENRSLEDGENTEIETLQGRIGNVEALIATATQDAQRRDAERRALPSIAAGSPAVVTRSESVYGPQGGQSFFADLVGVANRDSEASRRMSQHRALITDLSAQMNRAVDSSDIPGAYPTAYFPDLYVPDIAYSGPLTAFFATTPISAPNPIVVPMFDATKLTGDTDVQTAENAPLPVVEMGTKPLTLTPKTIGGETVVSRQAVDGASPGTDVIIANQLRELLMRDTEREIALVLEALPTSGAIADTAGTTPSQSGRDLHAGIASKLGEYYAGAAAGGAGARMLPAEVVFVNSKDWGNLVAGTDANGRYLLSYVAPQNALGQLTAPGFPRGMIGGIPVEPAWALLAPTNEIIARANDARQWKSVILDIRLIEREGPQSIVFAIWQYFAFAVLEPKGVRRYTYTNV